MIKPDLNLSNSNPDMGNVRGHSVCTSMIARLDIPSEIRVLGGGCVCHLPPGCHLPYSHFDGSLGTQIAAKNILKTLGGRNVDLESLLSS